MDQPSPANLLDHDLSRYSRQVLFPNIGPQGQRRFLQSRVTLIGCGAIGSLQATIFVRAGIGFLRICDRDFIEENNLQRQLLYDERDVAERIPKAEAARRKLIAANSHTRVEAVVTDVNRSNIETLVRDADLIADGTDNFETRFLINDVAVKLRIPWVYGAVIASTGLVMPIVPDRTPCLRCVFESAPPPGMTPTCDTAGVIAPAVGVVASLQTAEAMKIIAGRLQDIRSQLISIDVWEGRFQCLDVDNARSPGDCPCCGRREFPYLEGKMASQTTILCGRDAVQISPASPETINFDSIAERVANIAPVCRNQFLIRFEANGLDITVFPDGRAIIKGTDNPALARSAYARYVGH